MTVKELKILVTSTNDDEAVEARAKLQWLARFRMLNERIKELVAEQVKDKAIMRLPNNGRDSPEEARRTVELLSIFYDSQGTVHCRGVEITAALNLHHEMRGSNYRHLVHNRYLRAITNVRLRMLREEIEKECAST